MSTLTFCRIPGLLAAILFILPCHGQQNHQKIIDSLYEKLQSSTKKDTERIKLLNQYSQEIRFDSIDLAMKYVDEALSEANQIKDDYWIARSLYSKSAIYPKTGDFHEAIRFCDSAAKMFRKLNKLPDLIGTLNALAESYFSTGDYSKAIDIFHEVINLSEQTKDSEELGIAFGDIGNIYWGIEMYPEGIQSFESALKYFRQISDTMLMGVAIQDIGLCYLSMKHYEKAKTYYDSAIMLYQSVNRQDAVDWAKSGLGAALGNNKEYKRGIDILEKCLTAIRKRGNKYMEYISLIWLGEVIRQAADSIKNSPRYSYVTALNYELKGLQFATEAGDTKQQYLSFQTLSKIYEKLGRYKEADSMLNAYITIKDSVAGSNKKQEIAIKQIQFEDDKKQAVVKAESEAQIKRQKIIKNSIIYGAAVLLLAGVFLFVFYKRRRDAYSKQKEAELKAEISDTEMKALRAQMNPHFIFNSLNSISDYIAKNKTELADEYLTKFAKLMRQVLENSEKKEVTLSEDLKALELYMQLEALRLNNKFAYEIKVDNAIDKDATLVPALLLQPFVENSIWHGIAKKEGRGHIIISINKEEEMINCTVEDDGIGRQNADEIISMKDNTGKRSLGMKITKERIDIINKIKQVNASIKLTDLTKGTRVELKLPFESVF